MNIEIQKPNRIKMLCEKVNSRAEDIMFAVVLKLPEKMISGILSDWLEDYTRRRLSELQAKNIKQKWRQMALEQAIDQWEINENN